MQPDATDVPRMSTVHRGTAFEERSLAILHNLKTMTMSLKRVGGKEDGGIGLVRMVVA